MAKGIGESPARSPASQLQQIDFPATRDEIVEAAAGNDAPVEVINFLKCLPQARYQSLEAALRDFAEAERRFALGNHGFDGPDRRNLGRPSGEGLPAPAGTRHP